MVFRRAVARLAREAEQDPERLGGALEPIIDEACAAWDALTRRAEVAIARSPRNKARLRRDIGRLEAAYRKLPAQSPGRDLIERDMAALRELIADDTAGG